MIEYRADTIDPTIALFFTGLIQGTHFANWQEDLRPFAFRIAGTHTDPQTTQKRSLMSADWIVRTLVPIQFDQWAKTAILGDDRENAARWANQLRRLDPITDIAASANASQFADCASIAAGEAIVDTPQDATRELKSNEHTNIPYGDPIDYASSPALTASYVAEVAGMAAYVAANTKSDEDPEYAAKYAAEGANVVAHMPEIARLVWNASLKLLDQLILVTNATKICLN